MNLDPMKFPEDALYFIEACLKIVPKGGGLKPFRLNKEQLEVYAKLWTEWQADRPVRALILKARQLGFSTLVEALLYWLSSTHEFTNSLILSHQVESAHEILLMSQRFSFYDLRHEMGCMPAMANVSRSELVFDNPKAKARSDNPGLGSRIRIGTAGNKMVGHGSTLRAFHGSEVARWRSAEPMTGVLNALAFAPKTIAVLETTANGPSGYFYDIWNDAVAGRNEWLPMFVSWLGRKEYSLPLKAPWEPTPEEERIQKQFGATPEELNWRRMMISGPTFKGQDRQPEDIFREQYPLCPDEAFQSTGSTYFDMGAIRYLEQKASEMPQPLVGRVEFTNPEDMKRERPPTFGQRLHADFKPDRSGKVTIWRKPIPGHDYVIGADSAAGVQGGDYDHAYVMDRVTNEYVASIRAIMDPHPYADLLVQLGWYYNEAFIAAESNHVGIVVARRIAKVYVRCCYYLTLGKTGVEVDTDRPGWYTTSANRKQMFAAFRQALSDHSVHIYDPVFREEAKAFIVPENDDGKRDESRPIAGKNAHDDSIMSAIITYWVNDPDISGPVRRPPKPPPPPPKDWKHGALQESVRSEREPLTIRERDIYSDYE